MSEGTSVSAYVLRPFQTLVPRFQNKEDRVSEIRVLEYWSMDQSCSQSRTWRMSYQGRTYSIFKLKYLHDMSKVFTMLSIGINKEINQRTINKQNP